MNRDNPPPADLAAPRLQARGLTLAVGGHVLQQGLSFDIGPGLSLVRGGEGRGKTTLLRLLAGLQAPAAGQLQRQVASTWYADMAQVDDSVVARDWLAGQQARFEGWRLTLQAELTAAFGLGPHIDKPLAMLSTGSRRKVGLVAAAASGAALTLLDMPFAALDGASRRLLAELLEDAASGTRTWVLADHDQPALLQGLPLAACIDLGD